MEDQVLNAHHDHDQKQPPYPPGHVGHQPGKGISSDPAEDDAHDSRNAGKGVQPDEIEKEEIDHKEDGAEDDGHIAPLKNTFIAG